MLPFHPAPDFTARPSDRARRVKTGALHEIPKVTQVPQPPNAVSPGGGGTVREALG